MQSLNEELQTVNAELQAKVDDFSRVSNDMKNLLNSTEIATLFLDKDLKIRRFTNQATKIFKLIKSDIGRPFTDLVSDLIYLDLSADAHDVLKTLSFIKKQIPTKDGRWFSIRIMPYRTYDERVDGVVITFFNITDMKQLESELHETDMMHRLILNSCSDIIFKLSSDFIIQEFNPEAETFFGKTHQEVIQQNFIQMFVPQVARKKAEKELSTLLKNRVCSTCHMQIQTAEGVVSTMEWSANILFNMRKTPP
jgi:two-component system, chemotaxis family, CheB/CheR fusion protein